MVLDDEENRDLGDIVMIDTIEKAKQKVSDTWNSKELFIILSESQYINNKSVPRACQINENKIALSIFTTYESAVEFCKADGYIAEGEYLIGRIDNSDKFRDLYSILNTAAYLGINCSDIDCGTEDAMNVKLTAFLNGETEK